MLAGLIPAVARVVVHEKPERIPYLDALGALRASDIVLVLGTREPHYTASKVYPALASGKPVLALVKSQAVEALRAARGAVLVTFNQHTSSEDVAARAAAATRQALEMVSRAPFDRSNVLDAFRAESLAARLAKLLDAVAAPARVEAHA
jgi:hypothetical protein